MDAIKECMHFSLLIENYMLNAHMSMNCHKYRDLRIPKMIKIIEPPILNTNQAERTLLNLRVKHGRNIRTKWLGKEW